MTHPPDQPPLRSPGPCDHQAWDLPALLRPVSRSFYLTLRVLPARIRPQIGLAYLLARTTDTIADTDALAVPARLDALRSVHERVLAGHPCPVDLKPLLNSYPASDRTSAGERVLLERFEQILSALDHCSPQDQALIRQVLGPIISGQQLDLQRFSPSQSGRIVSLQSEDELDDYTFRVAGCVGEFWTRMCRAHLFPDDPMDIETLVAKGVRFGKGLQLVNVLRDLPRDLRNGRCYLPQPLLAQLGLTPADLLDPANESRLRPVYDRFVQQAEAHLVSGWEYTNTLPSRCWRVRLACAWPVAIGLRTLRRLRAEPVLDPARIIKISRADLRAVLFRSVVGLVWSPAWRKLGPGAAQR